MPRTPASPRTPTACQGFPRYDRWSARLHHLRARVCVAAFDHLRGRMGPGQHQQQRPLRQQGQARVPRRCGAAILIGSANALIRFFSGIRSAEGTSEMAWNDCLLNPAAALPAASVRTPRTRPGTRSLNWMAKGLADTGDQRVQQVQRQHDASTSTSSGGETTST